MNMKYILLTLYLIIVPVMAQNVPTPDQAVSYSTKADNVKWKMQGVNGNASGIIAEFVPEGQSIKAWKEMVAQQITFTKSSLQDHVKVWRKMIEKVAFPVPERFANPLLKIVEIARIFRERNPGEDDHLRLQVRIPEPHGMEESPSAPSKPSRINEQARASITTPRQRLV